MKHSTQKPPNWDKLVEVFPGLDWEKDRLIATWGNTYHSLKEISPDLIAHESTHTRQQLAMSKIPFSVFAESGIKKWWDRYYTDVQFRLDQEVEAYRNQVKYLKEHTNAMNRNERRARIKFMAESLSGHMYGNIISYQKAFEMINS